MGSGAQSINLTVRVLLETKRENTQILKLILNQVSSAVVFTRRDR